MSKLALSVNKISKSYDIGLSDPYAKLRKPFIDTLRLAKSTFLGRSHSLPPEVKKEKSQFWALQDVSFEVNHGETVGIIGCNGAGKSTLLKILSRITKPTSGYAEIHGRLGSLLEVGTGFHPELTGRENIYLNATILGLDRREIARRFDEIVAFAEIDQFIDTPVKFYSSGMYMRLAFSVSAHLDPEILILDEVLAVGDAAFQKKCMGKMEGVAKEGRTVLLVSHNIASILSFCDRCLLLNKGRLVEDGDAASVAEIYQESQSGVADSDPKVNEMIISAESRKNQKAIFKSIALTPLGRHGEPDTVLRVGCDMGIMVAIEAIKPVNEVSVIVSIFEAAGNRVIDIGTALKGDYLTLSAGEEAQIHFTLHNILLKPGPYRISLWMGRPPTEDIDVVLKVAEFNIEMDPRRIKFPHQYLAVYQCDFTHSINVGNGHKKSTLALN